MNRITGFIISTFLIYLVTDASSQELIIPLSGNPAAKAFYTEKSIASRAAEDILLELPIIDDFSNYMIEPDPNIWSNRHTFINYTYSVNPVTIGVATLDAVDFDGSLYPHATLDPNTYISDSLTSHPINLNYPASDSIYLSFYYQPEGLGEIPENQDSLIVQFLDIQANRWKTVWHIPGDSLHEFRQVMIPVKDSIFLKEGFRFQFKNLASLSRSNDFPDYRGNVDHWNIDYVKLDRNRTIQDTIHRDVAFTQPVPSILKDLESLPWTHFEPAYNTSLNPVLSIRYKNNDTITRNVTRSLTIKDLIYNTTVEAGSPTAQDLPAQEDTVVNFGFIYPFDFDRGEKGLFKYTASLRTDVFDNKNNDTVSRTQIFHDYYAYDDGSAEYGYGIRGKGSKGGKVALKYNIFKPDLLYGVDTYFNQLYDSLNLDHYFRFMIWDDNEGKPGSIIYEDERARKPVYSNAINGLIRFDFDEPVPVDGVIYVGWTQVYEYLLNIGLDVNSKPTYQAMYYNIGDGWQESSAPGTLILRPRIKTLSSARQTLISKSLAIYPNPANEIIHFDLPGSKINSESYIEIIDMSGRLLMKQNLSGSELNVSFLDNGLYFLRLRKGNELYNTKLLISK